MNATMMVVRVSYFGRREKDAMNLYDIKNVKNNNIFDQVINSTMVYQLVEMFLYMYSSLRKEKIYLCISNLHVLFLKIRYFLGVFLS